MSTQPKPADAAGLLPHVTEEGSRRHVLSWDRNGARCSEPNCEVNHQPPSKSTNAAGLRNANLIHELRRAERGLDCAGQAEAQRVADYATDLESGQPLEKVWMAMSLRYLPDNADFLARFAVALEADRQANRNPEAETPLTEASCIIDRLTHTEPEGWPDREMMEQAWEEQDKDHAAEAGVRAADGEWRPFETAPKDGTWIMARWVNGKGEPWPEEDEPVHYTENNGWCTKKHIGVGVPRLWKPLQPARHRTAAETVGAGWMPIETAPKDGTDILLTRFDSRGNPGRIDLGAWERIQGEEIHTYDWCSNFGDVGDPTHWAIPPGSATPPATQSALEQAREAVKAASEAPHRFVKDEHALDCATCLARHALAALNAVLPPAKGGDGEPTDAQLWDYVERNCLTVECYDSHAPGGDDGQEMWRVIEYHMSKPHERYIGFGMTPRKAIKDAMKPHPATQEETK